MRVVQRVLVAGITMSALAGLTGTAFAATSQGVRASAPSHLAAGPLGGGAGSAGDLLTGAGGGGLLGGLGLGGLLGGGGL